MNKNMKELLGDIIKVGESFNKASNNVDLLLHLIYNAALQADANKTSLEDAYVEIAEREGFLVEETDEEDLEDCDGEYKSNEKPCCRESLNALYDILREFVVSKSDMTDYLSFAKCEDVTELLETYETYDEFSKSMHDFIEMKKTKAANSGDEEKCTGDCKNCNLLDHEDLKDLPLVAGDNFRIKGTSLTGYVVAIDLTEKAYIVTITNKGNIMGKIPFAVPVEKI